MDKNELQKQIDYCEYVFKNAKDEDMKTLFCDIVESLKRLQRITKNTYFYLNDNEEAASNKFYDKYIKGNYYGAIGGGLTYKITPTSIGQITVLSCRDKDNHLIEEDITDTTTW